MKPLTTVPLATTGKKRKLLQKPGTQRSTQIIPLSSDKEIDPAPSCISLAHQAGDLDQCLALKGLSCFTEVSLTPILFYNKSRNLSNQSRNCIVHRYNYFDPTSAYVWVRLTNLEACIVKCV
ncbi:hypothetical protein C5167_016456 [Papaver somniferum]|nr:hypothetical protein C5167_016456 [Papaver somniferum]